MLKNAGITLRIRRPPKESRGAETTLTDSQFAQVLAELRRPKRNYTGVPTDLAELLIALRETGARPQEIATQRAALRWAAFSVGLLLMAAIISVTGDTRRLARVHADRAALRPPLESALIQRDSLTRITTRLTALRAFGDTPSLTAAIVAIGDALPADASVIQLRASGDTIYLNGEADHAAAALTALAQSPALRGVRLDAPIQQAMENGEVVGERFSIVARLASPSARRVPARPPQ